MSDGYKTTTIPIDGPIKWTTGFICPDWTPLLTTEVIRARADSNCFTFEPLLAELVVQVRRVANALETANSAREAREAKKL